MTDSKKPVGTMAIYRAMAKGVITPEEAGSLYVYQAAEAAAPKSYRPKFVPSVVWSLFVVFFGLLILPSDRRS